jgi:apolipoprotein N-acyltransferase
LTGNATAGNTARRARAIALPVAGLTLFVLSNGRWAIPVVAWVAPAMLLHWTRRQPALRGYFVLSAMLAAANMVAWWGTVSPAGVPDAPRWVPAALGPAIALVYLADRCIVAGLTPRLGRGHVLLTLPFPLAYTALDFVLARVSPLGSVGALGYSQYPNLVLAQLASVTGSWGLTFRVAWLAPVAESVWSDGSGMRRWSSPPVVFGLTLALILGFGGGRLVLAPASGTSVRVAGITLVDREQSRELDVAWQAGRTEFDRANAAIRQTGRDAALREAAAGAHLVVFSETSIRGVTSQEDQLVAWGAALARDASTTLVLPLYLSAEVTGGLDQNLLVVLDPHGDVVLRHFKYGSAGLEGIAPGSGVLTFADLPFGRMGAVICRDLDFPSTVQQAGAAGADLVVAPSFDWFEIDPFHTEYAVFRGIENGFSLVRQTGDGLSIATDPYGRVVASMDHFQSSDRVMIAMVPATGVRTPYGTLGDWFGWASLSGLVLLAAVTTAFQVVRRFGRSAFPHRRKN